MTRPAPWQRCTLPERYSLEELFGSGWHECPPPWDGLPVQFTEEPARKRPSSDVAMNGGSLPEKHRCSNMDLWV